MPRIRFFASKSAARSPVRHAWVLLGWLLALSSLAVAKPDERLIGAADLLQVKQIGPPVFSPDGLQIVYTVRSIDEREDRPGEYVYRTQLWLVTADGRTPPRQLTQGNSTSYGAVWHPKGDRIAFVRVEKDKPQIWVLPLGMPGGGEAFQLTRFSTGADHPQWSPEGDRLLFSARLSLWEARRELEVVQPDNPTPWRGERPGRQFLDTQNWSGKGRDKNGEPAPGAITPRPDGTLQEQREWLARSESAANPLVTTRLDFLGDQDIEPTETFSHYYVIEAQEGASPIPLTPGFASYQHARWYFSPTGLQILLSGDAQVSEHPDRILERDLWVANPTGGPLKRLLHDDQFAYVSPAVSPDGSMIAFLANDLSQAGYGQTLLCVLPTRGGPRRFLTTRLDRSVRTFRWAPDSQSLYFVAPSNGGQPLFRVPLNGAKMDRLTGFASSVLDFDVGPTGIAAVVSRPTNPYELALLNFKGEESSILSRHNSDWLKGKLISVPERREVATRDGLRIDTWVMKPTVFEANRRYPLLVQIHGGPQIMWGPSDSTMWHEFQYFAARGYGIVFCNPRGSSGYGYGFQRENFQNWGPGPGSDVLAAVDAAVATGWVDRDRQVITGGSYGGYLTAWIVSQDHRFKAAVAQRGVYDLSIFFGEGNAWRLVPYHFGGYPWQPDIRALLDAQSPLTHVAKITTPLLIKQGDVDMRAGVIQSEMLYKSLKVLGSPVEYVRYPGASHDLSRTGDPNQRIDRLVRFDEFFQRFIGRVEP